MNTGVVRPRVSAKDFFLWLGAMGTLYVSAISLVLLAHQYVNVFFPDPNLEPYGSGATTGIRFAIAFLIVFFPLYVWLTRVLHQDLRKHPEKKELWVGRWLVFLTLFVAGAAMAIDLVIAVNTFLNGELTMRFGLKALAILAVIGSGFWYYLEELKGTWEKKEGTSKAIAAVASAIVIAGIVGAFFIIGSPADERFYRIDDQKVNDLSIIQSQIVSYWRGKEELPVALSGLNDPLSGFSVPNDPESGLPYGYRTTGPLTFELCASFNKMSRPVPAGVTRPAYPYANEDWQHGEGEACFSRTIDPELYQPFGTEKVSPPPR